MTFRNCVAVDLGASSGRVMLARYERECRSLTLREIHRFKNGLHSQNGYVTWNVDSLESAIRLGLNKVCEEGIRIDSIGIDTWGVDFVLDKFCDEASCSERVLRQQFRQQTGMTINQYLRQVRVCHAQYLLQHSRLLISDISTECGFEDSNYFSVVFTRETGMTPSQWRHLNSQKD
jgi:AraC-like DNA-binding protein